MHVYLVCIFSVCLKSLTLKFLFISSKYLVKIPLQVLLHYIYVLQLSERIPSLSFRSKTMLWIYASVYLHTSCILFLLLQVFRELSILTLPSCTVQHGNKRLLKALQTVTFLQLVMRRLMCSALSLCMALRRTRSSSGIRSQLEINLPHICTSASSLRASTSRI